MGIHEKEMIGLPADILKPGLKALYYTGAHRVLAPISQGVGIIFMLHRVSSETPGEFSPNSGLMVTPDFLDSVLCNVKEAGLDIVSLDEAHERLTSSAPCKRFACFTLDDGYRDNLEHAYPVFKRHEAPFTIYVPSDYPEGQGDLWWVALENVIAAHETVVFTGADGRRTFQTSSAGDKARAFERIYEILRGCEQDDQRRFIRQLCADHNVSMRKICRDLIMTWDEISQLASDPLVTIGAHTIAHFALARLSEDRARQEMKTGADRLAEKLGARPQHLSYPYGDPDSAGPREFKIAAELGFKTAVTTRKGLLFPEHGTHLTALPRVSLNGDYQSEVFTQLYLSGAPFALWNRFRKVNAA